MRQRQGQGSGAVADTARPAGVPLPPAGAERQPDAGRATPWDELFRAAPADRQREALALAERQGGLVYGDQLPAPGPAAGPAPGADVLARLLAGQVADLEPLRTTPVEVRDQQLDPAQREAVA